MMDEKISISSGGPRRLKLRAVEPADAACLYEVENDESAWAGSDTVAPYSMFALKRYAESCPADPLLETQLRLIAVRSDDPAATVGLLDLYDISPLHAHAWVGIYVLPAMRGSGYAEEMIALAAEYARLRLRLANLGARILEGNAASRHIFEKCGFRLRGTLPKWRFADGKLQDMHLFTLPLSEI